MDIGGTDLSLRVIDKLSRSPHSVVVELNRKTMGLGATRIGDIVHDGINLSRCARFAAVYQEFLADQSRGDLGGYRS